MLFCPFFPLPVRLGFPLSDVRMYAIEKESSWVSDDGYALIIFYKNNMEFWFNEFLNHFIEAF